MLKEYDMVFENGEKVTVISDSISHAIEIAEIRYDMTVFTCKFIRNIDKLLIDGGILA